MKGANAKQNSTNSWSDYLRAILLFIYLVSFIWETLLESHGQSQCYVMEASYNMIEDLRISILSDSVVSQFLSILMARLVLKKCCTLFFYMFGFEAIGPKLNATYILIESQ